MTVDLSAEGLNEGTYHNTLAVASSDPFSPVDEVAFELEVTGSGNYVITDDEIDFGELFVGLSKVASATLKNNGTKAIVMDLMEAPTNPCVSFDWDGERTVLPGESVELAFKYTPTAPEEYEEEIKFSTDVEGMEELVLTLKGKAVNPPVIAISPDRLISYVKAEDVVNLGIMVSNQGEADLEYRIPATFWSKPGEPPVRSLNAYQRMRAPDSAPVELQSDEPTQPVAVFDDYGYSWSTSEMKSSRSYEWMDISAAPDLGIVTDGAVKVGLPFDFEFYGAAYDSLYIAGNGFVSFIEGGFATGTIEIPNPNVPNAIIAPYKKLLDPSSSGTIHYYPGNDFVIVQWQEVEEYSFFGSGGLLTFQVILYKDGTIKFQYKSVEEGVASNHVIGIENAEGIDGLQISRNNSEFISDEMAITVDVPQRGIVPAGETKEVMVTVDAAYLTDGVYYDTLSVFSNDVVMPEYEIPLKLDVKGMPKPAFYGSLSFGEVYAYTDEGGEAKSYSKYFSIKNEGSKVDHVMPLKVGTLSGGSIAGVTERTVFKVDGVEIGTEPIALQPDQSVTVELVFTPDPELSEAFDFSGYAIVKGDEPEGAGNAYYGVACSGSVMPAPEMQLKYDDLSAVLMPGETKEQTVKVLNNGKGLLQYKFRPKFGDLTIQKQLKYDSEPVTTSFIGLGNTGSKVILATKFVAPEGGFTLTHINNYYRSETLENYGYDMTVYRGGDNPTAGELVQTVSHVNEQAVEGDWAMTEMTEAVDFEEGEVFWIVIDYQLGTEYPQGRDTGVSGMEGIHKYSVDGGTSWKPLESDLPGTALKVRALSGYYSDEWLTVSDAVGTVQAGDSVELTVTFIADLAPVEENQVDVEVTSNDPMQQMLNIPASLTVNSAPAWVDPIEQSEIAEGETVTAFFRAVDKSALIYRIEGEKPNLGLEQSANGLELTFSPSFDMAGEHTFTMVAEDSYGATSSHTWTVNVQNVNRSPKAIAELERRIYLLDDKELSSESFKFKDLFADPDKTPFAGDYSLTDPSVAQVAVSETGFVLQPVAEGLAMVTLQGSDPEGEAASVSFEIEVRATNKAPQVAQPIGPRSVDFDKELSIDVSQLFADAEGDAFELSFTVSDESLVRTTLSNGVLHFAPLAEEGSVNVQLLAKDWKSSSTEEFTLKIVPNTVPELVSSISDLELNVPDQAKWLQLSSLFEDKDGDALTYAAEVENEGIVTINYQDGRLQLVPVASGVTTVTLTVSDGRGGVTTQQFRVSVSYRILEAGADALELGVYPNPMSDQGTLSYRIPEAGDVEIRIMSVTGKIVRIMNLGEQAEGSHTVALNRETLVKGMYMIQLVVDGKSQEVVRMFVK